MKFHCWQAWISCMYKPTCICTYMHELCMLGQLGSWYVSSSTSYVWCVIVASRESERTPVRDWRATSTERPCWSTNWTGKHSRSSSVEHIHMYVWVTMFYALAELSGAVQTACRTSSTRQDPWGWVWFIICMQPYVWYPLRMCDDFILLQLSCIVHSWICLTLISTVSFFPPRLNAPLWLVRYRHYRQSSLKHMTLSTPSVSRSTRHRGRVQRWTGT